MRALRLTAIAVVLGALGSWAVPSAASARLPPGVDALVSVSAHGRASTLVSPRLRTKAPHSLLLAFVVARGGAPGERVRRISAAGLRWSSTLIRLLLNELEFSDDLRLLIGPPDGLRVRRYPQAVAVALALRYSYREDLLRNFTRRLRRVPRGSR